MLKEVVCLAQVTIQLLLYALLIEIRQPARVSRSQLRPDGLPRNRLFPPSRLHGHYGKDSQ
jgi:hypothetical protein